MKLINKYSKPFQKDYYCDLTYELDKLTESIQMVFGIIIF